MINEWEQDADLEIDWNEVDSVAIESVGPPGTPITEVHSPQDGNGDDGDDDDDDDDADTLTADLNKIQKDWEAKLADQAARRDTIEDPSTKEWYRANLKWAEAQHRYVNEWNKLAETGGKANPTWRKNALDILIQAHREYSDRFGMPEPPKPAAPTSVSETPRQEEMIRTAIAAPKKGRLKGLKMRATTAKGEPVGHPMTIERAAKLRAQKAGDLDINIKAAQGLIATLDKQIDTARDAGNQRRVDALVNTRHKQQGQLDPMLKTQREFEASFRRGALQERPSEGTSSESEGPFWKGHGLGGIEEDAFGRVGLRGPSGEIATVGGALGAKADGTGLEAVGGSEFDPTFEEERAFVREGRAAAINPSGRAYAPVLPAEIVMGREAGGLAIYRHKDTGEEIRINPDDFTKEGNADHLQALKAGKLERVGFEKAEKPGTSYTDVDEKVVLAAVRIHHRLNQLNARIDQLEGDPDSGVPSLIKQEQARMQELQEGQRGAREQYHVAEGLSEGMYSSQTGEEAPPVLHEAAPGTIRDIQALQRELVNLRNLRERLAQIHTVTLGGYSPTQPQMDKYLGAFKDEPLPGTAGASKQAKANLRAAREQE